jgi:hypothetical protein
VINDQPRDLLWLRLGELYLDGRKAEATALRMITGASLGSSSLADRRIHEQNSFVVRTAVAARGQSRTIYSVDALAKRSFDLTRLSYSIKAIAVYTG